MWRRDVKDCAIKLHVRELCVAEVALMALGWLWCRAWVPVDAVVAAAVGVAGVALGDIDVHSAWHAWHLVTWTCTLRGKRGIYGTGLALLARLGPNWRRCRCGCLRNRRGPWRHPPSLCVAGGRRGTWWHGRALCVAGVAFTALGWLWWRAWVPVDAVVAAPNGNQARASPSYMPRLPRKVHVHVTKCHACHAKCTSISPSATHPCGQAPRLVFEQAVCGAVVCGEVVCVCEQVVVTSCVCARTSCVWESGVWASCVRASCVLIGCVWTSCVWVSGV